MIVKQGDTSVCEANASLERTGIEPATFALRTRRSPN